MGINKRSSTSINTIETTGAVPAAEYGRGNVKDGQEKQNKEDFTSINPPVVTAASSNYQLPCRAMKRVRFEDKSKTKYYQLPDMNEKELSARWYHQNEYQVFASNCPLAAKSSVLRNEGIVTMWEYVLDFCWDPDSCCEGDQFDDTALIQQTLAQHYSQHDTYGLESSFLHLVFPFWPGKLQSKKILGTFRRFEQVLGKTTSRDNLNEFFRKSSCHQSQSTRILARVIALSLEQSLAVENKKNAL